MEIQRKRKKKKKKMSGDKKKERKIFCLAESERMSGM